MGHKIVGLIPARGGSKGIPRKNLQMLAGKPLIAHTIETALQSKILDRVIVSTDDNEIEDVARSFGAETIKRPYELSTDTAPTEPVLEHALEWLDNFEHYTTDIIVLLQPTSPLREPKDIDEAIRIFLENKFDSLLSVRPFHGFIWGKNNSKIFPLNYDYKNRPRRQDKQPNYMENGAIYVTYTKILTEEHNRLGGKIGLYIMPEKNSIEIDTMFDLWLCEQIIQHYGEEKDAKKY